MTTIRPADLLADETPGGRALLAAELVQRTGRQDGPTDGRCEVCHRPGDSFTLADWYAWHCERCAIAATRFYGGDSRLIPTAYTGRDPVAVAAITGADR